MHKIRTITRIFYLAQLLPHPKKATNIEGEMNTLIMSSIISFARPPLNTHSQGKNLEYIQKIQRDCWQRSLI